MGGLTSLLLLLCVGVTVSTVLDLQKRIEGGRICDKTELQSIVKILDEKSKVICLGSLLENNWILTSAHCWMWGMQVIVGQGILKLPITAPPLMYGDEKKELHDIMLLKLPGDLPHTGHVNLPDCESDNLPKAVKQVQVAGYDDPVRKTLKCAHMTVTPCLVKYNNPEQKKYMFCGLAKGVEMCGGDSGGGVVFSGMIYGVHHGSVKDRAFCAPEAGFMNVCRYKDWIKEKTGIK